MTPHACHDRQPFRTSQPMQAGWYLDGRTRTPRLVAVPFRMSPDCNYTRTELGQADERCAGCKHQHKETK
ncbi:MAG: hypothetical protein C0449_21535 [Polaromonas sp.]|nr:hypothetical protein [Polaromonas sp.]